NGTTTLTGTFTDLGVPDDHIVTILWGDGTSSTTLPLATGVLSFSLSHRYLDNPAGQPQGGTYTIEVHVRDSGYAEDVATTPVVVNNVAPSNVTLTPSPSTVNENDTTTVSGSFADPGTKDTHTVVLNWGDGSPDTTVTLAAGVLTFSASH